MSNKTSEENRRYVVRWLKSGDPEWRNLKLTDDLKEARSWRDQWRKSSNCIDALIFDKLKGTVVS